MLGLDTKQVNFCFFKILSIKFGWLCR